MGDQPFARLIKRRRDALGFSQARLGELVGRSASTIRNWERGNSTPSERSDAVALAAVLGLDERDVLEGAGFDVESTGEHQTVEQAYASLAPGGPRTDEDTGVEDGRQPDVDPETGPDPDTSGPDRDDDEPDVEWTEPDGDIREAPQVDQKPPVADARPWQSPIAKDESAEDGPASDEDSTRTPDKPAPEAVSTDERPVSRPTPTPPPPDPWPSEPAPTEEPTPSRRLARAAPPTVLEAAPPGEPSYLEDPQERQQYRIRAVVTAALVIGLFIVLMWSFDRATDALSTLWDEFFGQLRF